MSSGDKLFGGMHDATGNPSLPHASDIRLACLVELIENGPFLEAQLPETDEEGFDRTGMNILVTAGLATRISVRGRRGFVAATEKGMDAYLSRFEGHTYEEAKRVRIATYIKSA